MRACRHRKEFVLFESDEKMRAPRLSYQLTQNVGRREEREYEAYKPSVVKRQKNGVRLLIMSEEK